MPAVESLFWIALVSAAAPLLSMLVPRRLLPEVVILLVLGVAIGPHGFELARNGESIDLLHDLGLAMLFLFAGFEIEPRELVGRKGRTAGLTWLACLVLAFVLVLALGIGTHARTQVAVAIALTSTALGTLLPILKDGGLGATPVGAWVLRHGAYGELGPIVAMALLLSTRGAVASAVVLAVFALIAGLFARQSMRLGRGESRLITMIRAGTHTTGQTPVRVTMLLLISLSAVATAFKLDVVLAAFAAGMVLRQAIPDGDEHLEMRIEGVAFGLMVPIFFVTSGMSIDPSSIVHRLPEFVAVIALIVLCRGLPVLIATHRSEGAEADLRSSAAVAMYSSTGLPIIVAVTAVAVDSGLMSTGNASLLVGAGTATVLLCPLAGTLLMSRRQSA